MDWKSTFKRTSICKNVVKLDKSVKKVQKVQKGAKVQKVKKARKSTKSINKHKKAQNQKNPKIQKSKVLRTISQETLDFWIFGLLFHFAVGPLGGGGEHIYIYIYIFLLYTTSGALFVLARPRGTWASETALQAASEPTPRTTTSEHHFWFWVFRCV